jgi:hypothetical protein
MDYFFFVTQHQYMYGDPYYFLLLLVIENNEILPNFTFWQDFPNNKKIDFHFSWFQGNYSMMGPKHCLPIYFD